MDLDPRFDQSIDDVIYYVMSVYKSVLIYDLLYYDDGLHNAMMGVLHRKKKSGHYTIVGKADRPTAAHFLVVAPS